MNKFRLSCVALFALFSHDSSFAVTWSGGDGSSTNWSTATNWSGNVAPVAGNALVFPSSVASGLRTANNNFAVGTSFASALIQSTSYTLTGNRWVVSQFIELNAGTGSSAINTPITLGAASVDFRCSGSRTTFNFGGVVDLAGHTLEMEANPGRLQFNANVTDSGGGGAIVKSGLGTAGFATGTTIAAASGIQINAGRVVMNGTCANTVVVASGAFLSGTGSATGVSVSGRLEPGDATNGTFTSTDGFIFSGTSTLAVNLGNSGGASDLAVSGGPVTIQSGAQLDVTLPTPMRLRPGDAFTLLRKTPAGAISGQFANAANGSHLTVGRVSFLVNYAGENGNDLVLTVDEVLSSGVTRTWDGGGADNLWSNDENWSDNVAVEAGDALVFPVGAPRPTQVNDLLLDLPIDDITIASGAYIFSGNRIRWIGDMMLTHSDADLSFDLPMALGTSFFYGTGQMIHTGSRTFTLKGTITEAANSDPLFFLRNEATGGGGMKIESAFTLPNTAVASRNTSATPTEWKPSATSSGEGIYFLGGNQSMTGPNSILLQGMSVGHDPFGYYGLFPATTVTLAAGTLWNAGFLMVGANSMLTSAPGPLTQFGAQQIGLMGNGASIAPGAGGSLYVGFGEVIVSSNVQATVNALLIAQGSEFAFDLGAGSVCQVKEISAYSGVDGYLEGGGRLGLGPVTNVESMEVSGNSRLELTASNSGSADMDVKLGTTGSFGSPGHLTGRGRCKSLTSVRAGSSVSPGTESAPYGVITCNSFASSSMDVFYDVAGLVPGVSMDQIEILQQADYTGFSFPLMTFVNGYAPLPLQELVIYKHGPSASIGGIGSGAMQITLYGQRFLFYTAGGDGNDIALQKREIAVPITGSAAGLPPAGFVTNQGTGQLLFQQQARGINGMIYVFEASTDLLNWTEVDRVEAFLFNFPPVDMAPAAFSLQAPVDPQNPKKKFFRIRPL